MKGSSEGLPFIIHRFDRIGGVDASKNREIREIRA